MQDPDPTPRFVRAVFAACGGAIAGLAIAFSVAWWTARINSSVRFGGDGVVFALWLALVYAIPSELLALAAALIAGERGPDSRARSLAFGALCGIAGGASFALADVFARPMKWDPARNALAGLFAAAAANVALALIWRFGALRSLRNAVASSALALAVLAAAISFCRMAIPERASSDFQSRASSLPAAANDLRVLVLGLDGADWRRIDPLVERGRLPNFKRLLERGLRSPLKTFRPTWSPIAWTTIATGVPESLHGVHDFTEVIVPGMQRGLQRTYANLGEQALLPPHTGLAQLVRFAKRRGIVDELPISSRHRRAKAMWNILSERGATVGVISWFASFPAEVVRGWFVSDNDPWRQGANELKFNQREALGSGLTHPPELLEELVRALPAIPEDERLAAQQACRGAIYADVSEADRQSMAQWPDLAPMAAGVQGGDRFSANAGLHVWREKKPQFLAVYLRAIDNLSHRMRQFTGVIDHTYEWTDALLGEYLDALDDRTLLVVLSDHGWDYEPANPVGHNHSPDGILVLYGAGVARDAKLESKPSILDVAPTVLAAMGLPASDEMPGRALREAFVAPRPGFELARIPSWGSYEPQWAAGAGEGAAALQAEGVRRLRALGYTE
jgi:hypothetical protein